MSEFHAANIGIILLIESNNQLYYLDNQYF